MSKVKRLRRICKCGCGGRVKIGNDFIKWHHVRGELFWRKQQTILCKCGCKRVVTPGSTYISGHNKKGCTLSDKHRKSISEATSGKNHYLWGKEMPEKHRKSISEANKGKVFSKEHRKNISLSWIGRECSAETRKKRSIAAKGRRVKQATRQKLSEALKGREFSDEHRSRISESLTGDKHPNWQGGISCLPYCPVWIDKEYKRSIKDRDNHNCQNTLCWGTSYRIMLHHISYDKMDCRPSNLITLCGSCNARANHKRAFWQRHYESILKKKLTGVAYEENPMRRLRLRQE